MGIIYDTLLELAGDARDQALDPVMEAEDITNDTRKEAAEMNGGEDDSSNEISLNTDNIFGDDSDGNDAGASSEDSDDSGDPPEDEMGGDTPPDDGGDGDEAVDDLEGEEVDQSEVIRKKQLRSQMLHLYNTIGDDITLMSEYIPKTTTPETNTILDAIKKNLLQSREYLHDILKDEYPKLEYEVLMKKYISLRQVYDLTTRAIEIHFKDQSKKDKR